MEVVEVERTLLVLMGIGVKKKSVKTIKMMLGTQSFDLAEHDKQIREEVFNVLKNNCKHSHFTYDKDSHCSGYNYCMLKGFDCICDFENCEQLKEQNK